MHDAVCGVPLVVRIISAGFQMAEGGGDGRLDLKVLHLDLRIDEPAVEFKNEILVAGKINRRAIHAAAIHGEPIFRRLRGECHPADAPGVGVALDVPFAIFHRWPVEDGVGIVRDLRAGARRDIGVVAPVETIGRHRPQTVRLHQGARAAVAPQQLLRERIPYDGLLDRGARIEAECRVELRADGVARHALQLLDLRLDACIEGLEDKPVPCVPLARNGVEIVHPRGRIIGLKQGHTSSPRLKRDL